jgi:hypothetical protein
VNAPDFAAAQRALVQARSASDAANAAAAAAEESRKALSAQLAQLARTAAADPQPTAERRRLEGEVKAAEAKAGEAGAAAGRAAAAAAAALSGFATFTDPRLNVDRLSDRSPFALMPVRLETRFVRVPDGELVRDELLVRIYPDDCWIDTFESVLSDTELSNVQRYWSGIWRAGGVEADERAAWRGLVAAHGSGRAGWIVDTYQPANLGDRPTKAADDDEILVIPTQAPLAAAPAAAITAYWQAIWLAGDDAAKQTAAYDALTTAVGAAAADELITDYRPYNLDDRPQAPKTKADVALSTAFVVFPPDPATKQASWTQAPRVAVFPERFVVLGYSGGGPPLEVLGNVVSVPIYVGPDPSGDPAQTIHPQGADLFVPDELAWMVDFDRAVEAGMGIRVPLTSEQALAGFDRLLVLGLVLSNGDGDAQTALEGLLRHHANGRSGLTLVPQGTPTHNTTGAGSGYTRLEDPDQSFDDRRNAPLFSLTADPMQKRDGQWLAELLGVDPTVFERVHGSDGQDQMQARAMQRALWPATLGYWMDKMLAPVFSDDTVEQTRWFLTQFVSGRGSAPAVRIGGQPYGILPTTAYSRIAWLGEEGRVRAVNPGSHAFLTRLLALLNAFHADWQAMSDGAAYVGKPGDAHQTLLDVVGLHPASVEYHSRYAESLDELYNVMNLWGFGPDWWQAWVALELEQAGVALIERLGYAGSEEPDILQHVFMRESDQIANVVDDRPLSESDPIRAYAAPDRNYIRWLIDAAGQSLDAVVAEEGFTDDRAPQALLYLYLRHALMLGYYDAGYRLHRTAGFLSPVELEAMKPEPTFVHVAEAAASESRFAALYKTEPRITKDPSVLVSDYITASLQALPEAADLADQIAALNTLVDAKTAQLERAFAEHIDVCSYRFDAWLLGIVNFQLQAMRAAPAGENGKAPQARAGVYLGAYAWLENLRPSLDRPSPLWLPPELETDFALGAPVLSDPVNGGYIHAPSLPHAQTAAILRSGYLANATSANPETMAVNLSSDRVRLALSLLEGIRNGQSLGALLGYRFERGLHDDHGLAEVDQFVYPLRKAFPLVADGLTPTKTPPDVPVEAIEARNVLDGRKLVDHMRSTGSTAYPFGLTTLPSASAAASQAIDQEAGALLDVYDAVADLALAEGVHQAAQGNFARVAATLDAYTSGNFPPDPEVVQTPAVGYGLTHRVALHLRPGLAAPAGATPRAEAEPAIDAFLEGMLPDLADVGCTVAWTDPVAGTPKTRAVTLADLDVRPIDVLELVKPDDVQAMSELDDRIVRHVVDTVDPRPDAVLQIQYLKAPAAGKLSIFEAAPLVGSLKTIVSRSRPLRETDAMLQSDAAPEHDAAPFVDRARITGPKGDLETLGGDIGTLLTTLAPLVADPVTNRAAIVAGIDGFLDQSVALLERASRFSVPLSGWGFVYAWRHSAYVDLFAAVDQLVHRWTDKLADFDQKILAYEALPAGTSDDDRFKALHTAELVVSTALDPAPATPAALLAALGVKRTAFADRRNAFQNAVATAGSAFSATLTALKALLPVSAFDVETLDLTPFEDRAVVLVADLARTLAGHRAQIDSRGQAAQVQLDAEAAAASPGAKAAALQAGAQALLGDDFLIVPEFGLVPAHGDEWANAVGGSAALLDYLSNTEKVDFPVDEWLTGAARIRPPLRAWEQAVTLASAFGRPEPELVPIQLPYDAAAPWLAMEYPSTYVLDSDRLLYTGHYSSPFDKTARQCGLLLDEWTETIPGTSRTTGITFNFDRPDNEPPQAILLVTPAQANGSWQWDDLVGALNETLDLAKHRAVEPAFVDGTPYSRFLPATVMAAAMIGISITTNLAAANDVGRFLAIRHA